jgi:hypothetical protein
LNRERGLLTCECIPKSLLFYEPLMVRDQEHSAGIEEWGVGVGEMNRAYEDDYDTSAL